MTLLTESKQNIILVAGANGFTGREIVRRLSAKGAAVRVLVRDIARVKALLIDTLMFLAYVP